jgi:phosphoribosyl-ATP pyrophosphohydrolase/phosphoribosyl-AMP cyclohydrolase
MASDTSVPAGDATGDQPRVRPSYTQRLLKDRNLRLKKIGEESGELIAACADSDPQRAVEEAADLVYHIGVALHAVGATLDDVRNVLARRSLNAPQPKSD